MHVMIMAQHYAPEEVSGAVLATDLATDLVAMGHQVTVVTCAPNYPRGELFKGYRNRALAVEWIDGVRIIRGWSYFSPKKTFWRRLLNYGTFSATALPAGLRAGRPDLIMSYSPPLPLGVSAWLLSRVYRIPWILRVEDLYPEAAVATGQLRNRAAINLLERLERFLYERATHISLISEGFRRNLLAKGVPAEKLSVTPVWADPAEVRPLPRENQFRLEHGLGSRFVIMYAGNLGVTSALDEVLDAAALLRDAPAIRFVIVGEGVKRQALMERASALGLDNVLFLPFQPRERFAEMLAAADVGLVTLNRDAAQTSLPSKTFNTMASGRPLLAVVPLDSEIASLVREGECGLVVAPQQPEPLADAIEWLSRDRCQTERLGRNGRHRIESTYSRERCVVDFARTFEGLRG